MIDFVYDSVLTAEEICNLKREKEALRSAVDRNAKVVVYGPRNYGKTSVIQSVIIPEFKRKHKNAFIFQVDLLEIRSPEALSHRVRRAFEHSFAEAFPGKQLLESAKRILGGLKPVIEIDPLSGLPTLSIGADVEPKAREWQEILNTIRVSIVPKVPVLLVFDEFQDVAFIPGAQAEMRVAFESFRKIPIIILGSKRHILSKIFAVPNAPLANFGEDLEFQPISFQEYHDYMKERFDQKGISITIEDSTRIQELLHRVPEPINIVASDLLHRFENKQLEWADILQSLLKVINGRRSRFQRLLGLFTENEQAILIAIAKKGVVKEINSNEFVRTVPSSPSAIRKTVAKLLDHSFLDRTELGYRLSDPLLELFLRRER